MSPAVPDPAVNEQTISSAGRRSPRSLRPPDASGAGAHKVILHLPDLTSVSARPVIVPSIPTRPPALPAVREETRIHTTAVSPGATSVQSPHFKPAQAAEKLLPLGVKPYAVAASTTGVTWRTADWKTRLATLQPTMMLILVGITAGVLIGWLWTGDRSATPPLEPAPAWQPTEGEAQVLEPDNAGTNAADLSWPDNSQPTMPADPPAATVTPDDPYDSPPEIEYQLPDSTSTGRAELNGTIEQAEQNTAKVPNEPSRPGLY